MKTKFYLLLLAIFFAANGFSQMPLPYYTGWDNTNEQAGWQSYRKADVSNSEWTLVSFNLVTPPNSLAHFYPVGGAVPTIDWYVSPQFDFSNGGKIDSVEHTFSGFGIPSFGDSWAIYLLAGSQDPDLATSKILIHDYTINYMNTGSWVLDTGMIIPPTNGSSYIAFQYATTVNWMDVQFDNLALSANLPNGVNENDKVKSEVLLFPNPAKNTIEISAPVCDGEVIIFDHVGKEVSHSRFSSSKKIDLSNFSKGVYIVKIVDDESSYAKRLVIE